MYSVTILEFWRMKIGSSAKQIEAGFVRISRNEMRPAVIRAHK
jgi:hypothetical protein